MSSNSHRASDRPVTVPWVAAAGERGDRLAMLTAYDYRQARLVDGAGADMVLVGDSLAMVMLGHDDTLSVTVDEMLHHVKAVRRGVERALLIADMPYGSFHTDLTTTIENALRFIKEGGAQAVKIEGARPQVVAALVEAEIPVMAHLGLTPQSVNKLGGYRVQGKGDEAAEAVLTAARGLEAAGAFSVVLECVPAELAGRITHELSIPTIGIGAGPDCDGQVLVLHDLLGLEDRLAPKFVRRYAELGKLASEALTAYVEDVRSGRFPSADESYHDTQQGPLKRVYG